MQATQDSSGRANGFVVGCGVACLGGDGGGELQSDSTTKGFSSSQQGCRGSSKGTGASRAVWKAEA